MTVLSFSLRVRVLSSERIRQFSADTSCGVIRLQLRSVSQCLAPLDLS
jgi:hypothetical protein